LNWREPMTERASFLVDSADAATLRDVVSKLAARGYSESSIGDRLGLDDIADLKWRSVPVHRLENLTNRDALVLAIDLFLLQGALQGHEVDQLFSDSEREALIRSGLLTIDEQGVARSRASLYPVGHRLIFSDHAWPELPHPGAVNVPYDQVMGIGRDSRDLARCTIRRPFRTALDLCTGSGIHALLAAAHTERVLAVDINQRAVNCTRFNADVSGSTNLEAALGDLFEPARGERFDLITANPPFVPSPLSTLGFRDGGNSGEDIQKRIIAGLPHYLSPGGIAQVVTEIGERGDESLVHRLREWLGGAPMDIHILRLSEHSVARYAIGHAQGEAYQEFLDSIHEWASNLRAQGYTRVVSLVITFQWSDATFGRPWERMDEAPPPQREAGPEIDAIFLAERLTRHLDFETEIKGSWLRRNGQIGLLDAQMLGSDVPSRAKATLLGQALKIEHQLDPVEREILCRMEEPIAVRELTGALGAVRSLLRRRLVVPSLPPTP
jgi:methylase of polypeptide subunit release factors